MESLPPLSTNESPDPWGLGAIAEWLRCEAPQRSCANHSNPPNWPKHSILPVA